METEQFHLLLPIQSVKSQKDLLTKLAGPKCTLPNAFLLLFEISEEAQSALSGFEMKGRLEAAYPWKPCQLHKLIQTVKHLLVYCLYSPKYSNEDE